MIDWPEPEQGAEPEFRPGNLETKYVAPPFSVLDTRQGYWQERRRSWLSLGIRSELGRDAAAYDIGVMRDGTVVGATSGTGLATSVFDPVLCELAYRWWAPPGGVVLDPFAGGSVRGIVAAWLGHPYIGVDLSAGQIVSNREQADTILSDQHMPEWTVGDSRAVLPTLPEESADLVFTCPPYYDLEVYGDDPADLSAMSSWPIFLDAYGEIIGEALRCLRRDRFAVVVVSEIRAPDGTYRGLVPWTIRQFELHGARYYNEAIVVNSAGTLPLRVSRYFEAGRKLGRAHQNVLVFVKGDVPRTHDWDYERTGAPEPQLDLFGALPVDDDDWWTT